ncbi:unnamed protein product [Brassica oleracea]
MVGDGSFPSERARSMERLCGCFVSVVCVCKQVKSFWDLSSMAAPPLFWFCPTFVMSSSLQGRVALTVSDRAFSYRIVCLFCVSPAWT